MCSIFGYNQTASEGLNTIFLDSQRHRGPEYENTFTHNAWTLGHQRLSIIDLSAKANQPMTKNGHTIVLNGEIYNYPELKEEYLKETPLDTTSDTEILLELLIKYGVPILNKLNGMFAFSWLNHESNELYICRDRFGVKPLHYLEQNGSFYFSSEIKPLIKIIESLALNPDILKSFVFDTATDFDQRTFTNGIYQLMPGHLILIKNNKPEPQKPWYKFSDFNFDKSILNNYTDCVIFFETLLTDAIRIRYRSDVPVCITLSGGLDSTTIYTLTKEHINSSIKPFTYLHPGAPTSEYDIAKKLTEGYNDTLVEVYDEVDDNIKSQEEVLRFLEFPIWNNSGTAYYEMYKAIKKSGFTVVVEGHGSDEQLGGYPYMIEAAVEQELYYGRFRQAYQLQLIANQTHNASLNQKGNDYDSYLHFLRSHAYAKQKHRFGNFIYKRKPLLPPNFFQKTVEDSFSYKILPIVLRTFDRLTMAHALESRSPFMDYRIVEFLRHVPMHFKVNNIGSKAFLREILKKYGKEYIYTNKAKMGFASDVPRFYNNIENKKQIKALVNQFDEPGYEYFKGKALEDLKKENIGWRDTTDIWKVFSLQLTKRHYGIS